MAIKAHCGNCGSSFQAKDALAGKRVKCPKCASPIVVGQATVAGSSPPRPASAAKGGAGAVYNPMLDLLDEVQVKSAVRGPMCPNCSGELKRGAVICVMCGYNVETGQQIRTTVYDDDDGSSGVADVGMTDADRIMAKAERDIDDMPVASHGQDFGDGADSFLIAGVAGFILLVLVGIGLTIIFSMDIIGAYINSAAISLLASIVLGSCMGLWITVVAFKSKPVHGIVCLCTAGLWCVVFGFMQGKSMLVPTVVMLVAVLVGAASGTYVMFNGWVPLVGDN
jgi:hypothetical protein